MNFIQDFFTVTLYQPLFNALIALAFIIPGHSIGWAIIALTVIIRLALLPSGIKVLEHQIRLRALQPKMLEIQKEHGKDKAAHSKAIMDLYAAEKVSPFSACLPTLVQLPIFIALYQVFIGGLSTDKFNLLYSFTPKLDSLNTTWFGLDLTRPEVYVLPVLAAGLQYLVARQMQLLNPTTVGATAGKDGAPDMATMMSKQMLYVVPVITYFFTMKVPAALGLYWVATTLFMYLQQAWFLSRPQAALSDLPKFIKTKNNVTVTVRQKGSKND